MPTPLFVFGIARSGTTHLANLLLRHPEIAGIEHEKHGGIHESGYFSFVDGRYGNLEEPANFIEFANVTAASDYFRLVGADLKLIYSLYPASYEEVFRFVMDRYAQEQNARYWIEKTPLHTLSAVSIARYYPDALFITIERNTKEVVASKMRMLEVLASQKDEVPNKSERCFIIATQVITWQHYKNAILDLTAKYPDRTISINFEDLREKKETVMRKLCDFLRIDFQPRVLESPYPVNSSFQNDPIDARNNIFSRREEQFLETCRFVAKKMPKQFLQLAYKLGTFRLRREGLPSWFFKLDPNSGESLKDKLLE